jgi:hypothetical protein
VAAVNALNRALGSKLACVANPSENPLPTENKAFSRIPFCDASFITDLKANPFCNHECSRHRPSSTTKTLKDVINFK